MVTIIDPAITPFVATFLFVFAIVFGLLTISKLFPKNVNALLALVFALFSVFYEPLVVGLQEFMPIAAIFLIIVFFIVFLKKVFGKEKGGHASDLLPIVVSLVLLLLVLATFGGGELIVSLLRPFGFDPSDAIYFVGLIIIIIIFVAVYYHRGWPAPKE